MHRAARALLLAASVSVVVTAAAQAGSGGVAAIPLNNGQETTDARFGGSGSFSYSIEGTTLCYTLSVRNLTAAPVAAHIHGVAGRNVAAGVLIPLTPPSAATGTSSACTTAAADLLAAISSNPGDYYVNVHTPLFPGGEVRGQLK